MGLQTVRHTAQLDWSNALSLYCNTNFNITQINPPCCHKYNLVDIPFALTQTFHCTIFTTSNVNLQQTPKAPHLIIAVDFMFCGLKEYASLLFLPTMSTQVALHQGNCLLSGVITLPTHMVFGLWFTPY
jgi:hypothetical protein